MKKVYAVNSGSYSDYRVNAMFSSKKLAKEFMQSIPKEYFNNIEEYELDPPVSDLVKRGYVLWSVSMLRDGTTEKVEKTDINVYSLECDHIIWKRSKDRSLKKPDVLISTVWAKTEKQAIKIVNEQRTQMIANGKWK
jgi:hypothetical protein